MSAEWNAAIEAAARVCDARSWAWAEMPAASANVARENEAAVCAAAIRALRRPEAARCDCGCQVHAIECDREEAKK